MKEFLSWAKEKLNVDKKLILLYVVIYFVWGLCMNYLGSYMQIAEFTYWWQIITCYILYMVSLSLLLRNLFFMHNTPMGWLPCACANSVAMPSAVLMLIRIVSSIDYSAHRISV